MGYKSLYVFLIWQKLHKYHKSTNVKFLTNLSWLEKIRGSCLIRITISAYFWGEHLFYCILCMPLDSFIYMEKMDINVINKNVIYFCQLCIILIKWNGPAWSQSPFWTVPEGNIDFIPWVICLWVSLFIWQK